MKVVREKLGNFLDFSTALEHVKTEAPADHALLQTYISAATDWLERVCDRVLIASRFTITGECIDISTYPGVVIESVTYVDDGGGTVVVSDPTVDDLGIPAGNTGTVIFTSQPDDDLDGLKQAGYMLVTAFFEERSNLADYQVNQLPFGVHAMIAPYRSFVHG